MTTDDSDDTARVARMLHLGHADRERGDSITPPLVASSVFQLPGEPDAPFVYGRVDTPVWQVVEAQLAELEGAPTVLFPSGMAAISSILYSTLKAGSRILIPRDGYYMTRVLADDFLTRFGIDVTECDTLAMPDADLSNIDLVFLETPSNPMLDVIDLAAICERATRAGTLTVADNTTCTALGQRPLDLGVDVVLSSDTKAAAGHSDVLMGHVTSRDQTLLDGVRRWRTTAGAIPGPFEAWLLHRGLATLELRLERMCTTAMVAAEQLSTHPAVHALRYPGLRSDPSWHTASNQMTRFGTLIGLTLESQQAADRFIDGSPYLVPSTSFGSVHSSAERRARWGDAVPEGFVRLSIGCEPTETLVSSLTTSLDAL